MLRLLRIGLSIGITCLAVYGLTWFLMAEGVVKTLCTNRLAMVRLDAEDAERQGKWLEAAHLYAHLIEYDQDPIKGCAAPYLNDKSAFLPFALLLIEARWGDPTGGPVLDPDLAREGYERALVNSKAHALLEQKPDTPALAHR